MPAPSPQDIELYCKSNKDGKQIGDCPFAQFIQLVLLKKGIPYKVIPTLADSKPDWLKEKHEGKLPCLVDKGQTVVDSLAIAEYIERTYPHSSLTRQGAYSYQEVLEKTAGFFPALSAFIKNKDTSKDAALQAAVEAQLDVLDEIIRSTPGQYICGIELNLADLYLTPQVPPALEPTYTLLWHKTKPHSLNPLFVPHLCIGSFSTPWSLWSTSRTLNFTTSRYLFSPFPLPIIEAVQPPLTLPTHVHQPHV